MKIKYSKKKLRKNLIFGILWLVISLIRLFFLDNSGHWFSLFLLAISILHFFLYYHESANQYISIENGIIKINSLFGKKMKLVDIRKIKKFAGDNTLISGHEQLTINTQIIDPESLAKLNAELEKLDVEWI